LARRVTWIKHELANAQGLVVVVDAGSSLLGEDIALMSEGRVMVEGMNRARYDAMAVGRMDALKGLEVLQARAAEAEFDILSANLVDPGSQELLFEPYTIIEREGARIGIIGISDADVAQMPPMAAVAAYVDATEAAQRYVAELRDQVDVLIVLSRLGLGENKELAAAAPGINVIIGGKTRRVMNAPERVGDTLITEMGYNGERGGKLTAFIGADGAPYDYVQEVVNLTDGYADDREAALMLDGYREEFSQP